MGRNSTLNCRAPSSGVAAAKVGQMRRLAPRSCRSRSITVGAQRLGVSLRYETGEGAVTAQMAGRWCRTPAKKCAAGWLRPRAASGAWSTRSQTSRSTPTASVSRRGWLHAAFVVGRVDATEFGHRLCHEGGDGVLAAHVARQTHRRPADGPDVVLPRPPPRPAPRRPPPRVRRRQRAVVPSPVRCPRPRR